MQIKRIFVSDVIEICGCAEVESKNVNSIVNGGMKRRCNQGGEEDNVIILNNNDGFKRNVHGNIQGGKEEG